MAKYAIGSALPQGGGDADAIFNAYDKCFAPRGPSRASRPEFVCLYEHLRAVCNVVRVGEDSRALGMLLGMLHTMFLDWCPGPLSPSRLRDLVHMRDYECIKISTSLTKGTTAIRPQGKSAEHYLAISSGTGVGSELAESTTSRARPDALARSMYDSVHCPSANADTDPPCTYNISERLTNVCSRCTINLAHFSLAWETISTISETYAVSPARRLPRAAQLLEHALPVLRRMFCYFRSAWQSGDKPGLSMCQSGDFIDLAWLHVIGGGGGGGGDDRAAAGAPPKRGRTARLRTLRRISKANDAQEARERAAAAASARGRKKAGRRTAAGDEKKARRKKKKKRRRRHKEHRGGTTRRLRPAGE